MTTRLSCAERFKRNASDLGQLVLELITLCYKRGHQEVNPNLIKLALVAIQAKDAEDLIQIFINHSHPHWEAIHRHDESFFIDHAGSIFPPSISSERIGAFRMLFAATGPDGKALINQEDRDSIWAYFDSLVRISINFVHEKRGPTVRMTSQGPVCVYLTSYADNIDLGAMTTLWGIKLDWSNCNVAV